MCGCADFPNTGRVDAEAALAECRANYSSLIAASERQEQALRAIEGRLESIDTSVAEVAVDRSAAPVAPPADEADKAMLDKLRVGRLERVWVEDLQTALPARIDTGAETASLDARNIVPFERDGKAWVRFNIPNPGADVPMTLERPLIREALVIQASSDEPERRPVIELGIQLGSVRQLAEFTLSDRSHLDFQMLVGRNILRDVMLVDVSETNLVALPSAAETEPAAVASEDINQSGQAPPGTGES